MVGMALCAKGELEGNQSQRGDSCSEGAVGGRPEAARSDAKVVALVLSDPCKRNRNSIAVIPHIPLSLMNGL